jgi:hypothetical protein
VRFEPELLAGYQLNKKCRGSEYPTKIVDARSRIEELHRKGDRGYDTRLSNYSTVYVLKGIGLHFVAILSEPS